MLIEQRRRTEVRTGREHNSPPTISLTFWLAVGAKDDGKDRDGDREREVSPL